MTEATTVTCEEFERRYFERSGAPIGQTAAAMREFLGRAGYYSVACDCGGEDCSGWRMTTRAREAIAAGPHPVEPGGYDYRAPMHA